MSLRCHTGASLLALWEDQHGDPISTEGVVHGRPYGPAESTLLPALPACAVPVTLTLSCGHVYGAVPCDQAFVCAAGAAPQPTCEAPVKLRSPLCGHEVVPISLTPLPHPSPSPLAAVRPRGSAYLPHLSPLPLSLNAPSPRSPPLSPAPLSLTSTGGVPVLGRPRARFLAALGGGRGTGGLRRGRADAGGRGRPAGTPLSRPLLGPYIAPI